MSYVDPPQFVTKMIDAGENKVFMSTRDTVIRAYMAGAILALAAAFAVTITVQTGNALLGAVLFPVGFCLLYLMGFDLLTGGVFTLVPPRAARQAARSDSQVVAPQLGGSGLRRQFPRGGADRRGDDRHHADVWIHGGSERGGPEAR